jgi:hypothetical protein
MGWNAPPILVPFLRHWYDRESELVVETWKTADAPRQTDWLAGCEDINTGATAVTTAGGALVTEPQLFDKITSYEPGGKAESEPEIAALVAPAIGAPLLRHW